MNPQDLSLVRSIAHDPNVVLRELVSPNIDLNPEWIQTTSVRRFVSLAVELTLKGSSVSWLALVNAPMEEDDREQVKQAWIEGRDTETDWRPIVKELKTAAVKSLADNAIRGYYGRVKQEPVRIRDHLGVLGLELAHIANDGMEYDPRPSAHLVSNHPHIESKWGSTVLDNMFDGGRPNHGFIVFTAPSGAGKSTMAKTLAAHGIAYPPHPRVVIMANEMVASYYATGILQALKRIWQGGRAEADLIRDMDTQLSIYDRVTTFEKFRQILYWERPQVAILDSINAVATPAFAERYSENERHRAKADMTLQTVNEFGCLLYAPGNMSEAEQRKLRDKPLSVNSAMLFNSVSYQNSSDYSFVSWRDASNLNKQNIKRVKNRWGSGLGEVWTMDYDPVGGCYFSN